MMRTLARTKAGGQSPTRPIGLLRVGQKVPRKAVLAGLTAISRRVPAPPHPVGVQHVALATRRAFSVLYKIKG